MDGRSAEYEHLFALARAGDAGALGQLLELYRNYLAVLVRLQIGRQLQGKIDASDLVQDTFLEAHRDFPQFRGTTEAEMVSWLRHILASNLADLVRRYRGTQRRDLRSSASWPPSWISLHASWTEVLRPGKVRPANRSSDGNRASFWPMRSERLPPDYREVILLCHFQGLSFPDVARRMGRSLDSVKHLWARALVRLRRSLGDPP